MFGFSRKRKHESDEAELAPTQDDCIAICKEVWRQSPPPQTNDPAALAKEIDRFAEGAFDYMYKRFPATKHARPFNLWLIVFTAISEAKTHPPLVVKAAIDLLRTKYKK